MVCIKPVLMNFHPNFKLLQVFDKNVIFALDLGFKMWYVIDLFEIIRSIMIII